MTTYEPIKGAVSLASNSPGMPTGYGYQAQLLAERLIRHGIHFSALSNYGLEGRKDTLTIAGKKVPHYPKGLSLYSDDVIPAWCREEAEKYPDLKHILFTLYDVWVYNNLDYDGPIVSWVPLDHITLPPGVQQFLTRKNVTAVTMSPHGQRQLASSGISSTYIPHGVETKVFKPTHTINGVSTREILGVPEDAFLVGMVAANKANGQIHRKAFAENLLAFSLHLKKYPNSYLYIHTEPSKAYGGFHLPLLFQMVGIPKENVIVPDLVQMRTGYPAEHLAAFYTAFDVLLSTSYGEGFGVPTMEAQACGTRVITSNFAASPDLVSTDSWTVDGQPFWDEAQGAFFEIPSLNGIIKALEQSYEKRGHSQESVDFAKKFDVDYVWTWYWLPFLKGLFQ